MRYDSGSIGFIEEDLVNLEVRGRPLRVVEREGAEKAIDAKTGSARSYMVNRLKGGAPRTVVTLMSGLCTRSFSSRTTWTQIRPLIRFVGELSQQGDQLRREARFSWLMSGAKQGVFPL
jgi:hypothetical protein